MFFACFLPCQPGRDFLSQLVFGHAPPIFIVFISVVSIAQRFQQRQFQVIGEVILFNQ